MAILPLAVAAPLAYTILDGQQNAERLHAERDSTALAAAIGARLDRTQQAVLHTASGSAMSGFLSTPQKTTTATARATLLGLAASADDGVRDVMVQDADGTVRIWISSGKVASGAPKFASDDAVMAAMRIDDSSAWSSTVHPDTAGSPTITVAAPILSSDGDTALGIVRVEISLAQVVGSGASGLVGERVFAQLLSQSGAVVAQARTTGAVVPADGAAATAAIPGFPQWRLQVVEPRLSAPTPLVLFGGLGLIVFAVGSLVVWMARQVIRPAEELEASRGRFRGLYEVARLDSLRDALTGLGNHRAFHEEFERQVDHARRYSTPLALMLVDLDDFKSVNDRSGHAAGDELLAEMGRLTASTIRSPDRAFRIGGDEFAILMPQSDAESARALGRRLLSTALETRPSSGVPNSFSFSIGISGLPEYSTDRRQLYAQADSALYWAKTHGRTMAQIFDPERHREMGAEKSSGEMSSSVAELTAKRALRAVYQPIVELRSGRVIGYEGLVRPTAESGFSNAGELFAAAEASGRQTELDQTCLEVVITGAAGLAPENILSLNLSPRTLESPEFSVAGLIRMLERHSITPNRVILELTERESVDDMDRLRQNVAAARAAGLRIAADDVGAGNAGLRLLSQMQFDIVKIDLSLVQGGPLQMTSLAVVRSLQELAQRWGSWVIAEGVETPEQLDLIRNLGISAAQGYLLGRPGDSLAVDTVDIGSLLSRDDWLHRLARTPHALAVGTAPGS
jgi:diguanylate cyclase (GGDEF)-like protein